MADKSLRDLLVQHYDELLKTSLTQEQKERFLAYLFDDAEMATVADLPQADPLETGYYGYVDDHLHKEKKKKNIMPCLRWLDFIYQKGGIEAHNKFIAEMLEHSYHGIHKEDFFFQGSLLGKSNELDYFLFELNDQIHLESIQHFKKEAQRLWEEFPADFDAIVRQGGPLTRLRGASYLYPKDPAAYGAIIEEVLPALNLKKPSEPIFNACTFTGFAHKPLLDALAEVWRKHPYDLVNRITWNKDYYRDFLDKSLFGKEYPYDENPPCEMDYLRKVADAAGVSDLDFLRGIYCNYDEDSNARYLAECFQKYTPQLRMEVFYSLTKAPDTGRLLHFYNLFPMMGMDKAPVGEVFAAQYEALLKELLVRQLTARDKDSEDENARIESDCYKASVAYLLEGKDEALSELCSDEAYAYFREEARMYDFSQLCGLHCQEKALADKIHRFADYLSALRPIYELAYFMRGAVSAYGWGSEEMSGYFMRMELPVINRIMFFDEVLLSDKDRHPKDKQTYTQEIADLWLEPGKQFLMAHEAETVDFLMKMEDFDCGVMVGYYHDNPDANPAPLVEMLKVKQKNLRARALKYIGNYPAARPLLEELQNAKRKDIREHADKALAALEKMNAFAPGRESATQVDENFDLAAHAVKNLPKTAAKLLSFTAPAQWKPVRLEGKEETADRTVLECYVCFYLQSKDMERLYKAEQMRPHLNAQDMKALAEQVFADWLASGADAKTKGAMTLLGIHGGEDAVATLKAQVKEFDNRSRSAMAGDAVKALAVSRSTMALVAVDNISRVYRNKLVRRIAQETMEAAAQSLGISVEQMADKVVPNLGLDEKGEMLLNTGGYGKPGRDFKVVLSTDLSVHLYDQSGKELKAFPKCNFDVDEFNYGYDAAKGDFSLLKKELKTVVKTQNSRLEHAMASGREWTPADFDELFLQNPIMQRFAQSLVFGLYRDGALEQTFRYAGDGSYCNDQDAAFALPQEAAIRICHPCDLSKEQTDAWDAQLGDYEITQPFPQLSRPVYDPTQVAERTYQGLMGADISVYNVSKLINYDWIRLADGDAGSYRCIYYCDKPSGLWVCLNFGGYLDIVEGAETQTTVDDVEFYKPSGSSNYAANDNEIIPVAQVPARLFSEVLYRLKSVLKA